MPQMKPMSWLFLYFYFFLMMYLITNLMYFTNKQYIHINLDMKNKVNYLNLMW